MDKSIGLGRVAVLDHGDGARRTLRALRELARAGEVATAVALYLPRDRRSRVVREADEAVEITGSIEDALRAARADSAWLGIAPMAERAAFADACARAGVTFIGPSTDVLRRLSAPLGLAQLATDLGVPLGSTAGAEAHAHVVEVVVARDRRGQARVLGVGDASLRRGEVAVLVESPSPALTSAGDGVARDLALRAAAAAGWAGVCAVRLLVDPRTRRWSLAAIDAFAHAGPAIEATAGVDLSRLALRLGAGAPVEGEAPATQGHAFAARIQAGDPESGAAAQGPVELLRLPSRLGVRADAAVQEGDEVPSGVDALATLVTRGETRSEALVRLQEALADADVLLRGGPTSKAWLLALCARPELRSGEETAGLLASLAGSREPLVKPRLEVALVAAALDAYDVELDLERARFLLEARRGRPRVGPSSGRTIELRTGGRRYRLEVRQTGPDTYRVVPSGGAPVDVRVERLGRLERRIALGDRQVRVLSVVDGLSQLVEVDGVPHAVFREPAGLVPSPMPAVVVAIPVEPGQQVTRGEPIARIESMKVEIEVTAPYDGVVREVVASVNDQVYAGAPLLRIDPVSETPAGPAPEPLTLPAAAAPAAASARDRYVASLVELRRLLLGFDVAAAEAKRLGTSWRDISGAAPVDDAEALQAEEGALRAFADLQSLFSRRAAHDAQPPLEELWRYLHEPEARGAELSQGFVTMLRRALAQHGVSLDAPGHALEVALLRIQKAHERAREQLTPLLGILERRLAGDGPPLGLDAPGSREMLGRLAEVGQEQSQALADLARELQYRRFDEPALQKVSAAVYEQAESDLARLGDAKGDELERLIQRLVDCPQLLATLLVSRMPAAAAPLRARLVETLMRRYFRTSSLAPASTFEVDGFSCATTEYSTTTDGKRVRLIACHAAVQDVAQAARKLARVVAEVPADRDVALELYTWSEAAPAKPDELSESLRAALTGAGFSRPLRRAAVLVAMPGRGHARATSQQHFTFRTGPEGLAEDRRYRGVHARLFRRLQLERFANFELERLPSVEEVYLYRAVARTNPKDERLFAAAEVRDLTPVRDAAGKVLQLPQLERTFHEALAGMRRFQARRAPSQRLEWNRVLLTVTPAFEVSRDEIGDLAARLAPVTEGLGLEMVLLDCRIPDEKGDLKDTLLRVTTVEGAVSIRWDVPTHKPLEPMAEYQQKVVQLRRRGLVHPFELVKMLAPPKNAQTGIPPGEFQEYDLDANNVLVPVQRPPGKNTANIVVGVVKNFTATYPEGMTRVILLGDPGREMGSVAEPECRRIAAAIELAEKMGVPLEWFEVCAGAKISMTSGTENMDWVSIVLRRIIEFTQGGGTINVIVLGITVGAQPYWNGEATMLMHTKGLLIMAPGSSMVLTGKQALEYSGAVSAEDNEGIGGYDHIMGTNGQGQYKARSLPEALEILMRWYEHTYLAKGEKVPRRKETRDPRDRDVRPSPHGPEGGAGFTTVGDVFSAEKNPDRKKPFEIRHIMAAAIDQDHTPMERWRDWRGGDTGVIWDAHIGGWPVCLVGIQSRPLPRLEFVPADGPDYWSGGTLFPQSSKKIARAINSASATRPVVVLANLSGFDGSPESMRRLQLEYGSEIGRAVVNFKGPIVFCVVSRYHGGAFVVFAKTLREDIEIVAVEGARASVIGGAPAAAVVFAREVETRTQKDPRVVEAEKAATAGGTARARLTEVVAKVRSEKLGEVGDEFDKIHSVERALKVGSLDRILAARDLRPYLVDALERGLAKYAKR
jgi:acetyl/propionyl-CoA carboxylase alpha subunit/acetyl-CoA carboxylase carboxyltransferase component